MNKQRLLAWDNSYKNTVVSQKKHYLLFYFQSPVSHFFRVRFCVDKDGSRIMYASWMRLQDMTKTRQK